MYIIYLHFSRVLYHMKLWIEQCTRLELFKGPYHTKLSIEQGTRLDIFRVLISYEAFDQAAERSAQLFQGPYHMKLLIEHQNQLDSFLGPYHMTF